MSPPLVRSFPPIAEPGARVLVLGTMPGARSLAEGRYYAHPQNAFWRVMGALVGFDPALAYAERVERLREAGVAVWDVLAACRREGSLDSAIDPGTAVPNAIGDLLQQHPTIALVAFNGGGAAGLFRRHVTRGLDPTRTPPTLQLPSTSPANARLRFEQKLEAWRAIVPALQGRRP